MPKTIGGLRSQSASPSAEKSGAKIGFNKLIETSIKDPRDVLKEIINDYPEIRKNLKLDAE